ncbi:hypothetical protein LTR35_018276 [Friedmanniomyces endolithicus]|nr:hypothetical protein LTR35_018276 [Friedmanniomyces endolithicus]
MDARSTFIAASEDETHDTQELVGLWQTAAFEFDEAFRHDISRDGFTAAHGSVSGTTSAPHTDAKDKRKVELRTGGALDCRSPRPAGVDTDDQGSICPAPRDRLDVEGAGGLLVAGSGLRPDSAQPFCRCDKIPSSAPSHPQSIAAATADEPVTEDPFGGLNNQSNAPVVQSSNSMGLGGDAARSDLEHGGLLAEIKEDSYRIAGPLNQATGAASDGSDNEDRPDIPRRWRRQPQRRSPSISDGCASDAAGGTDKTISSLSHSPSGRLDVDA